MSERTVARATSWAAFGVATSKAISLASTIVLARFLSPADFGLVALAAVTTDLVLLVQDMGLSPALVQHRGDPKVAAALVLRLHLAAAVALTIAIELAAAPIAGLLGDPGIAPLVRVLALGTLARGVGLVPRALLQRTLDLRALALADVTALAARGGVAVGLAWHGAGVWSLVAGDLTALVVQGVIAWAAWGGVSIATPAAPELRAALLRFGRSMTVANLALWGRDGLTRTLVGISLGPTALGYFHVAMLVAAVPVVGITHVSNRVALPVYAAAHDRASLGQTFLTTLTIVSGLALPLTAVLLAIAPSAVVVAFGADWMPVVPPLRILLVATMISALSATTGELFKALGRPQDLLRTGIPHLALLAIAIPLGTPYGLVGVATAIAAVRITMAIVALALAGRLLALRLVHFARAVAPALVAAALAMGAVGTIAVLELEPTAEPRAILAARTGAGLVAAAAVLATAWRTRRRASLEH